MSKRQRGKEIKTDEKTDRESKSQGDVKLLNKKRKRSESVSKENLEGSNETFEETGDPILTRKNNKIKRKIEENNTSESFSIKNERRRNSSSIQTSNTTRRNPQKNLRTEENENQKTNDNIEKITNKKTANSKRRKRRNKKNRKNRNNPKRKKFNRSNSTNPTLQTLSQQMGLLINEIGDMKKSFEEERNKNAKRFEDEKEEMERRFEDEKEEMERRFGDEKDKMEKRFKKEKKAFNKKINMQNKKIALLSEIYNQSEKYSNELGKYVIKVGNKTTNLLNACKVLYVRKICNFILEGFIKHYNDSLALTKDSFENNNKNKFQLIVFTKDIGDISLYHLNLIIDYLMETKQNCSEIVHMNNDDIPIMKEIFYILLNRDKSEDENKDNNDKQFNINIREMADIILENDNNKKEIPESDDEINNNENKEAQGSNSENSGDEEDKEVFYNKYLKQTKSQWIKNLLSNDKNNNVRIKKLIQTLKDKIEDNKHGIKILALKSKKMINSSYFYNLWKNSFKNEDYKKTPIYKKYINKKNIQSPKDMKKLLIKLLPKYEVNFFNDDPSRFSKRIKNEISGYSIPKK